MVCLPPGLFPSCSSPFTHKQMWDPHSASHWLTRSASYCLAMSPLRPGCPSPLLLWFWMHVSSLTPWLLDFHTVQFSDSSGCSLFLNLLSSFFWLCQEAKCIYLRLHLDWNSGPNKLFDITTCFLFYYSF